MSADASPGYGFGATSLSVALAARIARRIDEHALQPGTRLPSIRRAAVDETVSRSTVVEAYDRLIAAGYLESRRGSGFYVRGRVAPGRPVAAAPAALDSGAIDVVWLLRSMLRQAPTQLPGDGAPAAIQPGGGMPPQEWLDPEMVAAAVRSEGRAIGAALLSYGDPSGSRRLREQLAERLALSDMAAGPEQILTTAGATHAIDLIAREYVSPGDTVLVEDPAWFVLFARLAAFGARPVGVPRRADGPDLDALAGLLAHHRPKLFFLSSVLHNPTGTSIGAANAHRLLQMADAAGLTLVEDDIYGDLYPGRALRLASLDGLRRVIYVGGFSKTLAAGLRVGFIAAAPEVCARLADLKMMTGLASPELNERTVARILADGRYRRHVERLQARIAAARERTAHALERLGARLFVQPAAGMFLWADFGRDTNAIAARGAEQGVLCAPGSLFSPSQLPSTWMRVSVATSLNPAALRFLAREMST
jgi:hypothetical protein